MQLTDHAKQKYMCTVWTVVGYKNEGIMRPFVEYAVGPSPKEAYMSVIRDIENITILAVFEGSHTNLIQIDPRLLENSS